VRDCNAGFSIRDACPKGTRSIRGAVIGSEGMFGVVTRVLVRLSKAPQAHKTLLGVFETVDDASQAVSDIIACLRLIV